MKEKLKVRTKQFAVDSVNFCLLLPKRQGLYNIVNQLIRSSTSVGANYRAACRARSRADFIAKLSIVEEEADESIYWMQLLETLNVKSNELTRLKDEAEQILAIVVASKKTARKNQ